MLTRLRYLADSTAVDPLLAEALTALEGIAQVRSVHLTWDGGFPVFAVEGSGLSMDDIDRILSVKWDLLASHPGAFFDIDIHDSLECEGDAQ